MSEDASREASEHRDVQRAASQADHAQAAQTELPGADMLPGVSSSLLGDPRLDGRGNGPVRAAMMQRMQQTYGNRAVRRTLQLQRAIQAANPTGDTTTAAPTEGAEEGSASNEQAQGDVAIQREPAQAPAGEPGAATPGQGLIVEDSERDLKPEQMHKSAFLSQLKSNVNSTVESGLASTPMLEEGRRQVDQQFSSLSGQNARSIEQNLQREVPGAAGVRNAQSYIPLANEKVRRTIAEQVPTGVVGAVAGAASSIVQGARSVVSGIVGLFRKGREGNAQPASMDHPTAIQARLGTGQPLDGSVRSGLEPALGQSFSNVRVHTDAGAADLSAGLNARAFTVGQDIAFGAGEYQPGTPVGDALIAHELAHVVQQGQRSTAEGGPVLGKIETEPQNDLEEDADKVAVGAVARLWGGAREGLKGISQNAMPQLRSGLRLSRCSFNRTSAPPTEDYVIPFDRNPLSLPSEQILFNDRFSHANPAEFQLVFTGVGGHFDTLDTGPSSKTIPGLSSGNLPFFINSTWDGVSAVTVQLQVKRISNNSVVHTYNWTFGKKVNIPTTMTQAETEGDRPMPSVYTYT
ncbi:MAG TPA: DUF4157 domain-containing protein, partial [Chloroflexia bacterium]|nr:DUF4157 domain-containing protein [Chloroflexia bacterium]